jgi:type IV pilus assembly protein PilX
MKAPRVTRTKLTHACGTKQSGIVMFVALGVLILMTLAGLAMLRQMSGSVSIAGNLAFKQNATAVGDIGTEAAIALVKPITFNRDVTNAAIGYYSTWNKTDTDPASYFANTALTSAPITDTATGNTVRYVIHRMCEVANSAADAVGQYCANSGSQKSSGRGYPPPTFDAPVLPYFQITTQIVGPRNTVSYIQVVMN